MRMSSICLGIVLVAGCGDDKPAPTTCGTGTTLEDGVCVPDVVCGEGTTLENGMCVATPGTTCGPGTVLQGGQCVVDTTAPGPVTGFTATVNGSNVDLSWTAGANATSTMIVRLVAGAYDAPVPGTTYTVGQTLPGGATVVSVGSATSFSDPLPTPGRVSYLAYSIDADGTYGFAREAAIRSLPAQTGTIAIDVAANTATVMTQPANIALAVSGLAYDSNAGTLSFTVGVTNNTAGPLIQAKFAIDPSVGTVNNADAALDDGDSFYLLRPGATLPGSNLTRSVQLSGIAADATITIPVRVLESDMLVTSGHVNDGEGGVSTEMASPVIVGNSMDQAHLSYPHFSPTGRYIFGLSRWAGGFYRFDTATGDVSASNGVSSAGHGICQFLHSDGFVYAVFPTSTVHTRGDSLGITAAKLDPISGTVVARSATIDFIDRTETYECAKTSSRLLVISSSGVYVLDLGTVQFVDTDAGTAGLTPISLPRRIRHLASSPNGNTVYGSRINFAGDNEIFAIDPMTFQVSTHHTVPSTGNKIIALAVAPDGSLFFGKDGESTLYRFDGTTQTAVAVPGIASVRAIGPWQGNLVWVQDSDETALVNPTSGAASRRASFSSPSRIRHEIRVFDAVP